MPYQMYLYENLHMFIFVANYRYIFNLINFHRLPKGWKNCQIISDNFFKEIGKD